MRTEFISMDFLYVLLFLFLANSFSSNKVNGLRTEKIINGYLPNKINLKPIVAIMYNPQVKGMPDQNPCTGTILSEFHIITVAHCFYHEETKELLHKQFYVLVSTVNIWDTTDSKVAINVHLIVMPNAFIPSTPNTYAKFGNVAVIKTAGNIGLRKGHPTLRKLKLAREIPRPSQTIYVAGFGWNEIVSTKQEENGVTSTTYMGRSDGKLRWAIVNIINREYCQNEIIRDRMATGNTCAKIMQTRNEHKGICQGDSGAPLFLQYNIIGMAIHGFDGCNENQTPGIYVSLPSYYEFVDNVLNNVTDDNMHIYKLSQTTLTQFEFIETDILV